MDLANYEYDPNQPAHTPVSPCYNQQSAYMQQQVYPAYMHGTQYHNMYNPQQALSSNVYQHHTQLHYMPTQPAGPPGFVFVSNMPPSTYPVLQQAQAPQQQYMTPPQQSNHTSAPVHVPQLMPLGGVSNIPPSLTPSWSAAITPPSPYRFPAPLKSSPSTVNIGTPTVIPSRLKLLAEHYSVPQHEISSVTNSCSESWLTTSVTHVSTEASKPLISPFPRAHRRIDIKNSKDGNSKTDIQNLVDYYVNKHESLSHPKVMSHVEKESLPKKNLNTNNNANKGEKIDHANLKVGKNNDVLNWLSRSESELVKGDPDNSVDKKNEVETVTDEITVVADFTNSCVTSDPDDFKLSDITSVSELVGTDESKARQKDSNYVEGGSDIVIEEHELLSCNISYDLSEDNPDIDADRSKESKLPIYKEKDDDDDFEKFYFKIKASKHGISISSPEKKSTVSENSNSSQSVRKENNVLSFQKTFNDISSIEGSQSDAGDAFRLKASQSGILVQDPKERIEISTDSDSELNQIFQQIKSKKDGENLERKRHTSTPDTLNTSLDPKIPAFKPRSRKRAVSCELRADAAEFKPESLNSSFSLNTSISGSDLEPVSEKPDLFVNNDDIQLEQKEEKQQERSSLLEDNAVSNEEMTNTNVTIQASPSISSTGTQTVTELHDETEFVKETEVKFSSKETITDLVEKVSVGTQHFKEMVIKATMSDMATMTESLPELEEKCEDPDEYLENAKEILKNQTVLIDDLGKMQMEKNEIEVTEETFKIKEHLLQFVVDVMGLFIEGGEPDKLKTVIESEVQMLVDEVQVKTVTMDTASPQETVDKEEKNVSSVSEKDQGSPIIFKKIPKKKVPKVRGFMEVEDSSDDDDVDDDASTTIVVDKLDGETIEKKEKHKLKGITTDDDACQRLKGNKIEDKPAESLNKEDDGDKLSNKPVKDLEVENPDMPKIEVKPNNECQVKVEDDAGRKKLDAPLEKTLFDSKLEEFLENAVKDLDDDYSIVKHKNSIDELTDVDLNAKIVTEDNKTTNENSAMIILISEKMSATYGPKPDHKGDSCPILDNPNEGRELTTNSIDKPQVDLPISAGVKKPIVKPDQKEVFMSPPSQGGLEGLQNKDIGGKETSGLAAGMQAHQLANFNPMAAGMPVGMPVMQPFVDPSIYQAVEAQLKMLYPEIAYNPVILAQVAIQQTCILQMCLNSPSGGGYQTCADVNLMASGVNQLNGSVNQVNGSLNQLNGSVNQVNGSLNQLNGSINQVNGSVNQVNGSLNQLNGGVNQVSGSLNQVSGSANQVNGGVNQVCSDQMVKGLNQVGSDAFKFNECVDQMGSGLHQGNRGLIPDGRNTNDAKHTVGLQPSPGNKGALGFPLQKHKAADTEIYQGVKSSLPTMTLDCTQQPQKIDFGKQSTTMINPFSITESNNTTENKISLKLEDEDFERESKRRRRPPGFTSASDLSIKYFLEQRKKKQTVDSCKKHDTEKIDKSLRVPYDFSNAQKPRISPEKSIHDLEINVGDSAFTSVSGQVVKFEGSSPPSVVTKKGGVYKSRKQIWQEMIDFRDHYWGTALKQQVTAEYNTVTNSTLPKTDQSLIPANQPKTLSTKPTLDEQREPPNSSSDIQGKQSKFSSDGQGKQPLTSSVKQGNQTLSSLDKQGKQLLAYSDKQGKQPFSSSDKQGKQPLLSSDKQGKQSLPSSDKQGKQNVPSSDKQGKQPVPSSDKQGKQPVPSSDKQGKQHVPSLDKQGKQPVPSSDKQGKQPLLSSDKQGKQPLPSSNKQGKQPLPPSDRQRNPSSNRKGKQPISQPDKQKKPSLPSSDKQERQVTFNFNHKPPQSYSSSSNENWNDEVDDYAGTFTLYHNVHKPIVTMESRKAEPINLSSAIAKKASTVMSSSPVNELCDITLSDVSNKTDEATEPVDEWQEVYTRRRRHSSRDQLRDTPSKQLVPPTKSTSSATMGKEKQQKRSNFERLVTCMQQDFKHASRQDIIYAIEKIRGELGSLRGLSMEYIIEKAQRYIKQRKEENTVSTLKKEKEAHVYNLPPRMQRQSLKQKPQTTKPANLLKLKLPPRKSASIGFLKMDIPTRMKFNSDLDMCMNTFEEDMCVICHDPLSTEVVKELDCQHVFHSHCIAQWVERERTCPTCRQHALFPEEFPRLGK